MSDWTFDLLESQRPVIEEVLRCLPFEIVDENAVRSQIAAEFDRLLPQFVKSVVIVVMLPSIQAAAHAHFRSENVAFYDAEDLSMIVVQKIWTSLFGGVPFGNVGAWVATIRGNVHVDHIRKSRNKESVGDHCDVAVGACAAADRRAEWNLFMDELAVDQRIIVTKLREGDTWVEIAATLNKSVVEVLRDFHEIEWPEGFSPPSPKRRPRKRSS